MRKLIVMSLSVALSIILVAPAFSKPQPQQPKPTAGLKTQEETPLCYLQTSDGKTWNLNNLCSQSPKEANSSKSKVASANPYNNNAIKKFDDELYGEGN